MTYNFTCVECGEPFKSNRSDKMFCNTLCKCKFNNRRQRRGAQIYDIAMRMRDKRQKGDFSLLCNIIDRFLQMDREDGKKTYMDDPMGLKRE